MSDLKRRLEKRLGSRWTTRSLGLGFGLMLCAGPGGCAGPDLEPSVQRAAATPGQFGGKSLQRGSVVGGERVARVIAWPKASEVNGATVERLNADFRAALAVAPVPVLVPPDEAFTATAELYSGEHWSAVAAKSDEVSVTLNASGMARVYPHLSGASTAMLPHLVRGGDGLVTQNEAVWSASWIENGVAYDLSVECVRPTLPQCQDSAYIEDLVSGLVLVGGREVR